MRCDNDSWDITTSVCSTALLVAAARALEGQKSEPLVVDSYSDMFCRAAGGAWADLVNGALDDHLLLSEDFGADFVMYQGLRTRYFDAYCRAAAGAGVRQVVLLAAGLDSRAYRLDWPSGTVFFELDQPRVLEFKGDSLRGFSPKAERREVAVDLRGDWPSALRGNGFRTGEPSAWISEGLLLYLPALAQKQLFTDIDAMSCSASRLAVEEVRPMDRDAFRAQVEKTRSTDDLRGQWWQLVYNEQFAPAAQWFSERGWSTESTVLTSYMESIGLALPGKGPETDVIRSATLVSAVKG